MPVGAVLLTGSGNIRSFAGRFVLHPPQPAFCRAHCVPSSMHGIKCVASSCTAGRMAQIRGLNMALQYLMAPVLAFVTFSGAATPHTPAIAAETAPTFAAALHVLPGCSTWLLPASQPRCACRLCLGLPVASAPCTPAHLHACTPARLQSTPRWVDT